MASPTSSLHQRGRVNRAISRLGRKMSPQRALVLSFGILILVGAGVLLLPGMTVHPDGLSYVDALFTATSAVCVTGLIVVDTGTAFTTTGQLVILGLIQLGGLGIMTFSVFFCAWPGWPLPCVVKWRSGPAFPCRRSTTFSCWFELWSHSPCFLKPWA